jgi:hemerythrin-like domain-containing protein
MAETKGPNIGDGMIRFHKVITRALEVALTTSEQYERTGFPDDATRKGFYTYVDCLRIVLEGHHLGEDQLAFPCFRLRVPSAPIETLIAEHQAMHPMLEALRAATEKRSASVTELRRTLTDLNDLWHRHIGKEENHFSCQVLAEVLKPVEHIELAKELSAHGREHNEPASLTLPFVLFNLPPPERAAMTKLLPPIVTKVLVPVVWKRKWAVMKPFLLAQ